MKSYAHPNTSVEAPLLSTSQDELYHCLTSGGTMPALSPHLNYLADDLVLVAERLRCDHFAKRLAAWGIEARVIVHRTEKFLYVPACVFLDIGTDHASVDSDFCSRMLDRLASGLPASDAFRRTMDQCPQPVLSESRLRQIERDADAHCRRVEFGDKLRLKGWTEEQIRESASGAR